MTADVRACHLWKIKPKQQDGETMAVPPNYWGITGRSRLFGGIKESAGWKAMQESSDCTELGSNIGCHTNQLHELLSVRNDENSSKSHGRRSPWPLYTIAQSTYLDRRNIFDTESDPRKWPPRPPTDRECRNLLPLAGLVFILGSARSSGAFPSWLVFLPAPRTPSQGGGEWADKRGPTVLVFGVSFGGWSDQPTPPDKGLKKDAMQNEKGEAWEDVCLQKVDTVRLKVVLACLSTFCL